MDINPNARPAAWPRDVSPEELLHRLYQSAVQRALQVLSDTNNSAPHDEKSRDILFGKTQFQRR